MPLLFEAFGTCNVLAVVWLHVTFSCMLSVLFTVGISGIEGVLFTFVA